MKKKRSLLIVVVVIAMLFLYLRQRSSKSKLAPPRPESTAELSNKSDPKLQGEDVAKKSRRPSHLALSQPSPFDINSFDEPPPLPPGSKKIGHEFKSLLSGGMMAPKGVLNTASELYAGEGMTCKLAPSTRVQTVAIRYEYFIVALDSPCRTPSGGLLSEGYVPRRKVNITAGVRP